MSWNARLNLQYRVEDQRCVARYTHEGPLRVLQSLYPEGPGVCHNVLVHPPGGLVGGDTLDLHIEVAESAHGLVTTPGAARFYRSEGDLARQQTRITLARGARLEWLPLEALCYSGCMAENRLTLELDEGAELIGWDLTALGLPHAQQPFERGFLRQHLEWPGHWLERGSVAASDSRLLDGPTGLAGQRCMATLFLLGCHTMDSARREQALELARDEITRFEAGGTDLMAGATSPQADVVVVRALSSVVEPAMALLRAIRAQWRTGLWGLAPTAPRIWAM